MPCRPAVLGLIVLLSFSTFAFGGGLCSRAGASTWSRELKEIELDCDNLIPSTNHDLTLHVDYVGRISVLSGDSRAVLARASEDLIGPASMSWSPTSPTFFINDGKGSEQTSKLDVYSITGNKLAISHTVHEAAITAYRLAKKCPKSAADPNIWGLGWSPDGREIYVLAQAELHIPCDEPENFIGLRISVEDGRILQSLSMKATKSAWGRWLPENLRH